MARVHLLDEIDTGVPLLPVNADETWLHIDLSTRGLLVFRGDQVIQRYSHVAIGQNGADRIRFQGSKVTPTGTFRVDRINRQSRFKLFFGIDYPNPAVASEALAGGLISPQEAARIKHHYARHQASLPSTSLGGHIGIHGLGGRSASIHERLDWTEGCIALTDQQIVELSRWIDVGTQVVIEGSPRPIS
jgi:murein L,D-transpeptidase YafK